MSQPVTVFHAPKHKSGISLEGMEGTVTAVIKEHKGKELSANLPIRVQFALPADDSGKEAKLIAHLVRITQPEANPPSNHPPTRHGMHYWQPRFDRPHVQQMIMPWQAEAEVEVL